MATAVNQMAGITQGVVAQLISTVKSDSVNFIRVCKGFKVTVAGNVVFVTEGGSTVTLAVDVGDEVTLWTILRINSTSTTADGYTIEG